MEKPAEGGRVEAPAKRPRLDALTSLRFVAAAMIMLHHLKGNMGVPLSLPFPFGHGMGFGVSFFFLLSGFVLAYNYPSLPTPHARRRFLVSRFARLWPAHITALALLFLTAPGLIRWVEPGPWSELFGHLALTVAMIHTWIPWASANISFNDPNWSISTEFAFYLVFPLLIVAFARTWWWKLAGGALLVAAICYAGTLLGVKEAKGYHDGLTAGVLLYTWPPVRLLEFVAGMCTALAWQRFRFRPNGILGTAIEVAALVLFVLQVEIAMGMLGLVPRFLVTHEFWRWLLLVGCTILPGCILLFVMACDMGWISRLLSIPLLVLGGEISYSIYLLHYPVLRTELRAMFSIDALPHWLNLVGTISIVLGLSYLVWAYIERPAQRYIIGLFDRWPRRLKTALPVPAN